MRAFGVVILLAVAAVVVAAVVLVRDSRADAVAGRSCPPDATRVDLTLPREAAQVKIRVRNGTRTAGAADRVSDDFRNRGFRTQPPAESKGKPGTCAGPA